MNPVLRSPGSSFRGASKYYFHDKAQDPNLPPHLKPKTDDRVAFIAIRNCAADDPEAAINEMWQTAEMQDRLKRQAGVRAGGRRCEDPCLTIALTWHPSQNPSYDHVIEAADSYLKYMGAADHQAVYVGHNDTPHAHIHIILNRVNPENGRTLSNHNNFRRSQEWAKEYEISTQEIFCEKRFDPTNDNSRNLPHNVIDIAKPYKQAYEAETERAAKTEFELLKEHQKAERLAFIDDSKRIYRMARQQAYDQVRANFKDEWREHYALKDQASVHLQGLSDKAFAQLREGDILAALETNTQRANDTASITQHIAAEKDRILTAQKAATREAQEEAYTQARAMRDEAYQHLLRQQQQDRDAQRDYDTRSNTPDAVKDKPSPMAQILAAKAANQNIDPAQGPPDPANTNRPPDQAVAQQALGGQPSRPETTTEAETARRDSNDQAAAYKPYAQDRSSWQPSETKSFSRFHSFDLGESADLRGRSGITLEEMHEVLKGIPRNDVQHMFTIGLGMHHEFRGAEASYNLYALWAEGHPFFKQGVAADLWEQAGAITHDHRTLDDIRDIAELYRYERDTFVAQVHDYSPPPFGRSVDMAAGAIGTTANYIADQLGELFAPSTPAELAARGRAAAVAEEIKLERQAATNDMFIQYADKAMRAVEEQRLQERDRDYWDDYERKRERDQ